MRLISYIFETKGLVTVPKPFNIPIPQFIHSLSTNQTLFFVPNPRIIFQLLKHCLTLSQLNQIHAQVITNALSQNKSLLGALLCSCISTNNLSYARFLFVNYSCPSSSTFLCNLMIQAYSKIPNSQESFNVFHQMLAIGRPMLEIPDKYTFTFVITACSRNPTMVAYGKNVHGLVIKYGCESNIYVGNSLVNMYTIFRKIQDAHRVFDEMPKRDVVTWTSLVRGYANTGNLVTAHKLFDKMPERNDVSWAVIIAGYVGSGRYNDALRHFNEMLSDDKVKPNEAILVCVLSACAHLGALDQGKWVHVYIDKHGVPQSSNISTALIDMYAKCGRIDSAYLIFSRMSKRDVLTWTSLISGLSMHGLGKDSLQVFFQMLAEGINPDNISLLGVLIGCSHSGLVEDGCFIFYNMERLWGIVPKIEHYGCLIDLLGRAGKLERAFEVVKRMPIEPDAVIWRALLSACRIHGNVNFGERILDHIAQLDSSSQGEGYVLLSNLYASLGQWDKVTGLRNAMNMGGYEFRPGCSWIEIHGVMHEFLAADRLHPQIEEIHDKLNEVLKIITIYGGYVPNTKQVLFDLIEEEKEQALSWHSEKLAVAFGLLNTEAQTPIRIVKNLRICEDCHSSMKAISLVFHKEIVVRDRSRFHTFRGGNCTCTDFW
ncbi:pentatricopeptide repeat-containing protein At5g66520-like isoform X1 [Telopea speciosissima]|uniref:pentatricopeptide repeat-containing protein At5g66520-like isoform X1 n=1 Tax=Telopea speciosissima TaxID=54955 RepID=UPI001CC4C907|nr:pentatricopeptide repeat-containing protein At5g66520-like isoform X1 [Telopea speciosissima]